MTYAAAKQAATKKNAGIVYKGDAGNDCTFEVHYCSQRKRQVWVTITKDGFRII